MRRWLQSPRRVEHSVIDDLLTRAVDGAMDFQRNCTRMAGTKEKAEVGSPAAGVGTGVVAQVSAAAAATQLNELLKSDILAARLRMLNAEHNALRNTLENQIQEISMLRNSCVSSLWKSRLWRRMRGRPRTPME